LLVVGGAITLPQVVQYMVILWQHLYDID